MSKSVFALASLSLALSLSACRFTPENDSDLTFAHYDADSAYGGPLGRLEAIKQGFTTNFTDLTICVETGKQKIADDEILLETRLAYAAWLAGSGLYDEADWQKFKFVPQAACDRKDKTLAGFVILVAAPNDFDQYQEQQISCTKSGGFKSCQGKGVTLGWGGPGGLTSWFFNSNPNKWTKIELARGSSTTLSPYVDWLPLTSDIKRSKLDEAQKQALTQAYEALKINVKPTMAQLVEFMDAMEQAKLVGAEDPVFGQMAKQFYGANLSQMTKAYRGEYSAFATILHEVGHQFGMDHAHHPGLDSTTGVSSETAVNEQGQNVTDIATMAYGLRYNFLTEDDKAGIKSDALSVRSFLQTHK